jgi:hypothetical protein
MRGTFFRYLWRFNAIAIAIAAVSFILLAVFSWRQQATMNEDFDNEMDKALVAVNRPIASSGEFGALENVPGTPFAITGIAERLTPKDDATSFGYEKGYDKNVISERNLVIIDSSRGTSRHVLPDNSRKVLRWETLGDRVNDKLVRGRAYIVLVSSEKTEGKFDLLLGNFDTGKQAWIAFGIDAFDLPDMSDPNQVLVLISKQNQYSFLKSNLSDLTVTKVSLSVEPPR